jgi:hypothetical protein
MKKLTGQVGTSSQMAHHSVAIGSAQIRNAGLGDIHSNFQFIVGQRVFTCPRVVAHVLSPKVCLMHSIDASLMEYVVQTRDSDQLFELYQSLGQGSVVPINDQNSGFLLSLSRELGNIPVYLSILEIFQSSYTSSQFFAPDQLDFCPEASIEFISSEFFRLKPSELEEMSPSTLYQVLSHPRLRISSEDSLYSFICSRITANRDFYGLFRFVRFEYLSNECVQSFVSIAPHHIDSQLWSSLSRRLMSAAEFLCPFKSDKPRDGIISHLANKYGRNIHDDGIITITSKSVISDDPYWAVRNLADPGSTSCMCTKNGSNEWVCWDFQELRVQLTDYAIFKSPLRSWVIEISVEGRVWVEIDRRQDNEDLKGGDNLASFHVAKPMICRFIRITQTGPNHTGANFLSFVGFEFFGGLFE